MGGVIDPDDITGWVLAGGPGTGIGAIDRGLHKHEGLPLAMHVLLRLAPQVGNVMINANRNLGAYESFGVPVWPDGTGDPSGPLSALVTGLEHCETPWLVTVPCDAPRFPLDLVQRLACAALAGEAPMAMVITREAGVRRTHPSFCLLKVDLLESLVRFSPGGPGGAGDIEAWAAQQRCADVEFDDPQAFSTFWPGPALPSR